VRRWRSSGNRVNAIPATILARVWPGRKRARRGTRLRAWNGAPGAREGGRRVTVRVLVVLDIYFVSVKYMFVSIKLMCVYVKLLKI
jgi:hypothetical protein